MQITVDVPEDIAQTLAADPQSLSRTTLEALALEGVRSGKLSTGQFCRLLDFSTRMAADGFLKDHGVDLPLSMEDVENEAEISRRYRELWSSSPTPPRSTTSS